MRALALAAVLCLSACTEGSILTKIGNLAVRKDEEAEAIKEMQARAEAQFRAECWDSDKVPLQAEFHGNVLVAGKPGCGMLTGVDLSDPLKVAAVKAIIESAKARYGPALQGVQITINPPSD